jgi:hypothetical protein
MVCTNGDGYRWYSWCIRTKRGTNGDGYRWYSWCIRTKRTTCTRPHRKEPSLSVLRHLGTILFCPTFYFILYHCLALTSGLVATSTTVFKHIQTTIRCLITITTGCIRNLITGRIEITTGQHSTGKLLNSIPII